jgi:hypothetical protein
MEKIYECSRCGVVSRTSEHLCSPQRQSSKKDYCGSAPQRGTMCESMQDHLPFVCGICGRPAGQAELICKPWLTG